MKTPLPSGYNRMHKIKVYSCVGHNTINIIMLKDTIVIPEELQKYPVEWYHTYFLHTLLN